MKKLLTISFVTAAFLFIAPSVALASDKTHGENKHSQDVQITKSETKDWPQGKSKSDPDDNGKGPDRSNGGYDKPGYSGGVNSDRDGNNGCGNDSDREDDNEGWCGLKPKVDHNKCETKCDHDENKDEDKGHDEDKDKDHGCDEGKNEDNGGNDQNNEDNNDNTDTNETVSTPGQVLGAVTNLPDTGITDSILSYPVFLAAGILFILSGLALMVFSAVYKKSLGR